jgi:acyl-coenzyme A thioesterase PaaI-like protein
MGQHQDDPPTPDGFTFSEHSPGHRLPGDTQELLRAGLEAAVPFNRHNNIRIVEVGTRSGTAELPDAEHLKNHLGTQHGAALFAVAEAAAGAAYIGAFLDHLQDIRMNAQEVHITYLRWAKGPITARSTLTHNPATILATLDVQKSVDLSMPCQLYDAQETIVARISIRFKLKRIPHDTGSLVTAI